METRPPVPQERVISTPPFVPTVLFLVFLVLSFVATQGPHFDLAARLPANADALINAWTLKTACEGLAHPATALRGNMFFPDTMSLLYSEPLLGLAVQSAPLCAIGMDHVTLFNVTYVVTLALCALGAWLLAREITGSAAAALVAAVVFAFTTANYDSSARLQIVASQWTPFCLLYLIRFCRSGRIKDAILMSVAFALQAWSCTYYEIFLAILLVLATPFWVGLAGGIAEARRRWLGVLVAILVALAFVLPLNVAQRIHLDPILVSRPQAQDVELSFFTNVLPTNVLYGDALGRDKLAYDALYFPGVLPIVLAVLFLIQTVRRRDGLSSGATGLKAVIFIGVTAFLFGFGATVATRWGEIPGPLALFSALPGVGQARVPSRFFMFSRLALAIVAACGAALVVKRFPRRPWMVVSILSVVSFAEHYSAPLDTWVVPKRSQLPKVYEWLEQSRASVGAILEFPPSLQRLRREEATWLHLGAFHGVPMANGYSSFRPAWFEFVMETALQSPDQRLLDILRQLGVRTVVVHPRPRGLPELDSATTALLDYAMQHPEQLKLIKSFSDAQRWAGIWARLGDEKVFEIQPASPLPTMPREPSLDRSDWSCRGTEPGCEKTLDGDTRTLFEGRAPQGPGQSLRVFFKAPVSLGAVSIGLGRSPEEFPRDPVIRILQGDTWTPVDASLDVQAFLFDMTHASTNPVMRWRFSEATVSGFEIRLRSGGHAFRELGVAEVNAHAAMPAASVSR